LICGWVFFGTHLRRKTMDLNAQSAHAQVLLYQDMLNSLQSGEVDAIKTKLEQFIRIGQEAEKGWRKASEI